MFNVIDAVQCSVNPATGHGLHRQLGPRRQVGYIPQILHWMATAMVLVIVSKRTWRWFV